MRYTVRFSHSKYLELIERFVREPDFHVPEGVYRGLDVVVEAPDPKAALQLAAERLGWPDKEVSLVPYSVTGDIASRAAIDAMLGTRALLELWRSAGVEFGYTEAATAVGLAPLAPRPEP